MTDTHDPGTADALLAEAKESSSKKNAAAMNEALQGLSSSPDCSARHRFEAAKLFAAAGATADAIQYYREAGAAYIDPEGDTGRAREAFSEAHALDIENLDIIFEIARVDMIEGHPRAALAKFSHILRKSDQAHVPALFEAACIYQQLGQHDQAVLTLRKVLDRDKTNVQAIISMGQRLESMGMLPEAVGYFIQASTAAQAAGQMGTCRHVINMVVGLDPTNQVARRMLAEIDDVTAPVEVQPDEAVSHHIRRRDQRPANAPAPQGHGTVEPAPALAMVEPAAPANSALAVQIDDLALRSDRIQHDVSALTDAVAVLEKSVEILKTDLSDRVNSRVSARDGVVAELEETVATLKAKLAEIITTTSGPAKKSSQAKPKTRKATAADVAKNASMATATSADAKSNAQSQKVRGTKPKPGKRLASKAPLSRR